MEDAKMVSSHGTCHLMKSTNTVMYPRSCDKSPNEMVQDSEGGVSKWTWEVWTFQTRLQ